MEKTKLEEFLEEIRQDCYLDSNPENMLAQFQQAIQSLERVRTKIDIELEKLKKQ